MLLPSFIRDHIALILSYFMRSFRFDKRHRVTCTMTYRICNTVLANQLADSKHNKETFRATFRAWRKH